MIEVLKFRPDDSEIFYKNLVWTFQHVCIRIGIIITQLLQYCFYTHR